MTALVIRGDARTLPLPDASVDLIVTSPPYWALRSYTDGGEHYAGQIGDEPTPAEYVDNLLDCTREWMRVLKPSGSIFVNLGDKYNSAASGGRGKSLAAVSAERYRGGGHSSGKARRATEAVPNYPSKSLLGLPWRYALGCVDELGLILRAEIIWSKPNGLPESVTDRVRRSHEQWFHLVKQPRYFSAVDEIREPHTAPGRTAGARAFGARNASITRTGTGAYEGPHPLGKLPGSVWEIATQPLKVPDELGVEHFAAFPTEWPRRLILGWSPSGICLECGEGRRPMVFRGRTPDRPGRVQGRAVDALLGGHGPDGRAGSRYAAVVDITGYACACPDSSAPTRPAVVLDPFGGTGTTALVASVLGRVGITVDRSADYCRIAQWRTQDPGERARALGLPKPQPVSDGQSPLFEVEVAS